MKKFHLFLILFGAIFNISAQINGSIQTQASDWQLVQNEQYTDIQTITPPPVQLMRK